VTRGRIGVAIDNVPKDAAESLGLGRARGAYVGNVESGGPADKAGIEAGDIVLKYNGRDVEKAGDLQRQVGETKPGTRATVQVWRKGATRDLTVTVAELQADTKVAQRAKGAQPDNSQQGPGKPNALGLVVADLSDGARREFKTKSGVEVQVSEGPAARVGIRPGDLILRVGDTDVTNAKQFNEVVAKLDKNRMVAVFVRRGDATQVVTLRPSAARSGSGQ
jgi:serine protease Do